jgi:hypothetical protein
MGKTKFSITTNYITNLSAQKRKERSVLKPLTVTYDKRELKSHVPFGYFKPICKIIDYTNINLK